MQAIISNPDLIQQIKDTNIEPELQEYMQALGQLNIQVIPNKEVAPGESTKFLAFFDKPYKDPHIVLTFNINGQEAEFAFKKGEELK